MPPPPHRKALFSLQAENEDLKHQLSDCKLSEDQKVLEDEDEEEEEEVEEEEEELDVTIEGEEEDEEEEDESSEMWEAWDSEASLSQTNIQTSEDPRKTRTSRPAETLHLLPPSSSPQVHNHNLTRTRTRTRSSSCPDVPVSPAGGRPGRTRGEDGSSAAEEQRAAGASDGVGGHGAGPGRAAERLQRAAE